MKKTKEQCQRYDDTSKFGGNRKKALERDRYMCLSCGMTREEHKKKWNRDITVDHIDGKGINSKDKNNKLSNLQTLCLSCHGKKDSVNIKHNPKRGEDHCNAKLTENDVLEIREQYLSYKYGGIVKMARKYKVSGNTILEVVKRETWRHI